MRELEAKFFNDLCKAVEELLDGKEAERKFMLSGGIDSILLLTAYDKVFGAKDLKTYTMIGTNLKEIGYSRLYGQQYFKTDHTEIKVTLDDFLDRLHLIQNMGFTTVFQTMFYILMWISIEKADLAGATIIHGGGADPLQGSSNVFMYTATNQIAESRNVSVDEARDIIKKENYQKRIAFEVNSSAWLRSYAYKKVNGTEIAPYYSDHVSWLAYEPFSVTQPKSKRFFKSVMKYVGVKGVDKIQRVGLQLGTGLYYLLRKELEQAHGMDANKVIKKLSKKDEKCKCREPNQIV